MTKFLLIAALAASACTAASAHRESDNRPLGTIRWSIDDLSGRADGKVQLSFRTGENGRNNSNWSNGYAFADLPGLSPAQLAGGSQPVRFAVAREAGRLDCTGTAGNQQGIGTCAFAANPSFTSRLVSGGIGQPTERQSFYMTLADVRSDLIQELGRQGYAKPDVSDLVSMGIHGATASYVRDIASAGYRLGTAKDLVKFRIFKVQPDLVRAWTRLGYSSLDPEALVKMQIHGVTPAFVTEMARLGYRNIPADQLVRMRIHGVTPQFVQELQSEGITPPSPDQLVRLRLAGYRAGKR